MKRIGVLVLASGVALMAGAFPAAHAAPPGQVSIKNFAFNPRTLTISVGRTVTWVNNDNDNDNNIMHTVTSDTGVFQSGSLSHNQRFSFAFRQAGTYPYHCSIHPFMMGTIAVTGPSPSPTPSVSPSPSRSPSPSPSPASSPPQRASFSPAASSSPTSSPSPSIRAAGPPSGGSTSRWLVAGLAVVLLGAAAVLVYLRMIRA